MKCCGKEMSCIKSQFPSGAPKYEYTCKKCRKSTMTSVPDKDRKRSGNVQAGAGKKVLRWT